MPMQDSNIEALTNTNTELSRKRAIGTTDPDYVSIPDAKKLKILEERGEEELCERVIKVVEKEFYTEIMETELQIEDIDSKLLKVQQYMHTLRYLSALKLFSLDKVKSESVKSCEPLKLLQDNHPAVRRYATKSPSATKSTDSFFQTIPSMELPTTENLSSKEGSLQENKLKSANILADDKMAPSPSCNKEIIPIQPESRTVITQGRKGRLQRKIRIVVGNTYQYLRDALENGTQLKFKWRVYVRGPPDDQDISSFVSSVSFTLDKSYAPHDVIKICEFPFTISRRGWGEFKIHLELCFHDPRNKPVKMLHSLRLSRHNDPLALTGLWRLGEETWYDVWLYDKIENQTDEVPKNSTMSSEEYTKQLIENLNTCGIKTKTVYSDSEGNVTLSHESAVKSKFNDLKNPKFELEKVSETISPVLLENSENKSVSDKKCQQNDTIFSDDLNKSTSRNESDENARTLKQTLRLCENVSKNGKNLCKILIRRADGKLVSCMVPKEMYEMALKLSAEKNKKSNIKKVPPLNENSSTASVENNNLQSTENHTLTKLNIQMPNSNIINNANNSSNNNNIVLPLNSKRIVFKQNSNNNNNIANNIKHSIIRMQSLNGLTNLTVKQPNQALTLRFSSPVSGPIKLQTTGTNKVNQLHTQSPLSSVANLNSSVPSTTKVATNSIASNTPTKNARILQTPDGCKFLVTSNVLTNKVISDNTNNSKQAVMLTNNNTQLLPGTKQIFSNQTPLVLNKKILCKFPTSNLNTGIITMPSKLKVSPITVSNNHSTVFNIKPSNVITPSITSTSDTTRKVLVHNSPQLVKMGETEAIGKTHFQNFNIATSKTNLVSKQNKYSHLHKLIEKNKMDTEFKEPYEKKIQHLKSLCMFCHSEVEVIRFLLKGLPIICEESADNQEVLLFAESSADEFGKLPLGRRRAIECWRAREIKKVLISLNLPNHKSWNLKRIVSWARKQGFSPMVNNGALMRDICTPIVLRKEKGTQPSSITVLHDIGNLEKGSRNAVGRIRSEDTYVVVDSENEQEEELGQDSNSNKERNVPIEHKVVEVPTFHSAEGCQFVDTTLSKLRLKLHPEEFAPGVMMEVAKNVMWKATLSFMEDLIRSSYSAALDDQLNSVSSLQTDSEVHDSSSFTADKSSSLISDKLSTCSKVQYDILKTPTIDIKHIQIALITGRPEFDLFTYYGLGKYKDKKPFHNLPSPLQDL